MSTLDDLNPSESNVNELILVRDAQGNEYICNIRDLKPVSEMTEEEKRKCVRNVEPENR